MQRLDQPTALVDLPRYWSRITPAAPAVWEHDAPCSYAKLMQRVDAASVALRERGVGAGDRVLIVAENGLAEVVLLLATTALLAWPVPLNARLSAREVAVICDHCQPRLQVFATNNSAAAAEHAAAANAQSWFLPDLDELRISATDAGAVSEPADLASEVALLIYTSGTTGAPKGVMVPVRGLLHAARVSATARAMNPADRIYGVLPLSHIFGISTLLLATLYAGASIYLEPRFDARRTLRTLADRAITLLPGVPMMFRRVLDELGAQPLRAPAMRYLYIGGGALDPALKTQVETTFGLPLHHGYGMTEYAGSMTITALNRPRADCACGELNAGCELRFVDEQGRDLAAGEPGEIWGRGPGVMRGYYRAPELTREAVTADGWLKTGDIGRLDADGALFILGRSKDLIKCSGFNVYPQEVEGVLAAHPQIKSAAVLGLPAADGNEVVVAVLELEAGAGFDVAAFDVDALRAYLVARLAPYKRPGAIHVIDIMPANENGKIRKREVLAWLQQR